MFVVFFGKLADLPDRFERFDEVHWDTAHDEYDFHDRFLQKQHFFFEQNLCY